MKAFKQLLLSAICMVAFFAIAGCDKDNSGTDDNGKTSATYVDLGLSSGTKWKDANESNPKDENNFYTYDEAMSAFGNNLPTNGQFDELLNTCEWTWTGNGYKVVGPSGKSINMPAGGIRTCMATVCNVGSNGYYWSSSSNGSTYAKFLYFNSGTVELNDYGRCGGMSVRLVKK